MQHRLTPAEKESLPHRYLSGESSAKIAKSLGVTDVAILVHLKKMGIKSRDPSKARRVYPLWDEAFSELTSEAAYWVGFLMADGCVLDESKIQIGLAEVDVGHLRKLRQFLHTEARPLYYTKTTKSYQLKVHSRQLVLDLAKYGVIPRKSLTAVALNEIHLEPAFWLGVIDGDGTLSSLKYGRVRIFGTGQLMQQFVSFLVQHQVRGRNKTFSVKVNRRKDGLHEVGLEGQRARNFLTLVYAAGTSSLDRKKLTADKILGSSFSTRPNVDNTCQKSSSRSKRPISLPGVPSKA